MKPRQRVRLALAGVACGPLALAGCTGGSGPATKAAPVPPPAVAIAPAANATNVPISSEVVPTVTHGKVTEVILTDDKGARIEGTMRPDGSSWLPGRPLDYKRAYTAQVTASNDKGRSTTQTAHFTTMAKPEKQTTTVMYVKSGQTYGVNMPVTVAFDPGVAKEARAAVQKRLFVTTDPPQPGTWSWLEDGTQAYYRAPDPWKPNTKLTVRAALAGLPMGKGSFGDAEHTAVAAVAPHAVRLDIDNKTKQILVFQDERLVKKIPVSLGKPSTPSSSGDMVIMEKHERTTFDTRGEPNGGYVVDVDDAQRLTWGGEFIHAAPWSEGDQGYTNVSHGCANVSNSAASYLMGVTHVGDLVRVRGTEVKLDDGNGWTAWNKSWEEFVKGSALPVSADLKPQAAAPPLGSPAAPVPGSGSPGAGGSTGSTGSPDPHASSGGSNPPASNAPASDAAPTAGG